MSRVVLASLHLAATSLYLGGAITMELVLRYAQRELPGPQTAVTCQVSGRIWRWWAQATLLVAGGTFLVLVRQSGVPPIFVRAYAVLWGALAAVLALLSYKAHPALSRKIAPFASKEERSLAKEELRKAIRRMDRLLRLELGLASLLTLVTAAQFEWVTAPLQK